MKTTFDKIEVGAVFRHTKVRRVMIKTGTSEGRGDYKAGTACSKRNAEHTYNVYDSEPVELLK